jgi:hypothetical protein
MSLADHNQSPDNVSGIPSIFLSEPASFSVTGSGYFQIPGYTSQDDIWLGTLTYTPGYGTIYPSHEACIAMSCRAIDYHQSKQKEGERKPALTILSQLLNERFSQRNTQAVESPQTVNDLFDLSSWSTLYGPRSVLAMTKMEWWGGEYDVCSRSHPEIIPNIPQRFYADPIDESNTATFVKRVLQSSPRSRDDPGCALTPTRQPEGLECLPTELLDTVCSYLSIPSIIALHRTSIALAIQIPLDAAFWRNGLRDGSLHPHIWDLDTNWIEQQLLETPDERLDQTSSWDWRSVAKLLTTKRFPISGRDLRLVNVPNGFWNRCRIWATMEEALQEQDHGNVEAYQCDTNPTIHEGPDTRFEKPAYRHAHHREGDRCRVDYR